MSKEREPIKSKSGKTIQKVSKTGKKYWFNEDAYLKKKEKLREGREIRGDYKPSQIPKPRAPKSEYYMRYFERKLQIKSEYVKWIHMTREESRECISRLYHLMLTDEDFNHYIKIECKTLEQKAEDDWWETKNKKDEDYDGKWDEYHI